LTFPYKFIMLIRICDNGDRQTGMEDKNQYEYISCLPGQTNFNSPTLSNDLFAGRNSLFGH
jgi:hypothetical protein